MEKNLTSGSVFKNIVYFSLPYLLSYFLQTLYGMADLFIVGQFHGVEDITAVSVGSQVMHMLTVMIVGLAMGATVTIGKAVGAKRQEEASLAVGNTASLFMGVSAVATVLLLFLVKPMVFRLLRPTILSVRFSAGLGIQKARCILLPLHVRRILRWIICLSACLGWGRREPRWELRCPRQSV